MKKCETILRVTQISMYAKTILQKTIIADSNPIRVHFCMLEIIKNFRGLAFSD